MIHFSSLSHSTYIITHLDHSNYVKSKFRWPIYFIWSWNFWTSNLRVSSKYSASYWGRLQCLPLRHFTELSKYRYLKTMTCDNINWLIFDTFLFSGTFIEVKFELHIFCGVVRGKEFRPKYSWVLLQSFCISRFHLVLFDFIEAFFIFSFRIKCLPTFWLGEYFGGSCLSVWCDRQIVPFLPFERVQIWILKDPAVECQNRTHKLSVNEIFHVGSACFYPSPTSVNTQVNKPNRIKRRKKKVEGIYIRPELSASRRFMMQYNIIINFKNLTRPSCHGHWGNVFVVDAFQCCVWAFLQKRWTEMIN